MEAVGRRARLIAEATRAAAEAITLGELAQGALTTLVDAFDAPLGLLYSLQPDEGFDGILFRGPKDALPRYREYSSDDPLVELKARTNLRLGVTSDLVDRKKLLRSAAYNEVYRPLGIRHQLVARLSPVGYPDPGTTSIVFARLDGQSPWERADLTQLREVLPALEAAARRAARFGALEQERAVLRGIVGRDDEALAAFSLDGKPLWRSARAERALGAALDEALVARVRQLGREWGDGGPLTTEARVRFRADGGERTGELFVVGGGNAPTVLLRIDPGAAAGSPVERAAAHYGLRPSEARVLEALSRGLSNVEIGRELFISRETVRTHVGRILARMRVRSRLEAVTKLRRFERR
jgi:DNA-binding CsgD family transcriptional regulator